MNLYTDSFICGDFIVKVAAIYIHVYTNYIYSYFKKDYPYLYWALTLVCLILILFSPMDLINMYNKILDR